jgi:hypothetical protein
LFRVCTTYSNAKSANCDIVSKVMTMAIYKQNKINYVRMQKLNTNHFILGKCDNLIERYYLNIKLPTCFN